MRNDSNLQKLEIHLVAAVAVVVVSGLAFALSTPFSAEDYAVSDVSVKAPRTAARQAPGASHEVQPALLEPALRSLDGVAYHG